MYPVRPILLSNAAVYNLATAPTPLMVICSHTVWFCAVADTGSGSRLASDGSATGRTGVAPVSGGARSDGVSPHQPSGVAGALTLKTLPAGRWVGGLSKAQVCVTKTAAG